MDSRETQSKILKATTKARGSRMAGEIPEPPGPINLNPIWRIILNKQRLGLLTFQFRELLSGKWVKNKTPAEAEGRRYKWHSQDPAVLEHVASVKNGGW
jgi:hypothetical protein